MTTINISQHLAITDDRDIVEELFTAGRIRAVFATETLALGINAGGGS